MQLISISKLNISCGSYFRRVVIKQTNLAASLCSKCWNLSTSLRSYSSHQLYKFPTVNPGLALFCYDSVRKTMAVSRSQAAVYGDRYVDGLITDFGNGGDFMKPSIIFFGDNSIRSCLRANVKLRNHEVFSLTRRGNDSRLLTGSCSRHYHASCSVSNDVAADVPFDISVRDEQSVNSEDSSACPRTLKLKSGSCYLPHPEKIKTGGEDAHFICEEEQVIGVADGVGGWADVGVDAGFYARLLMSNSVTAIKEKSKGSVDPAKVLEKAYSNTKVEGSSTACIVALTDQGINAINLGDSAFIVIRDGTTVFRSAVQQYGFNFPYQLGFGNNGDVPSSGQVFTFPVAPGDVLVAGTDGLFDNMYDNEIAALVVQALKTSLDPQITAQNIANLAQERAQDSHRQTPFSAAAHDAGLRYVGGKLDDITVVVSYIAGEN